ncbi:sensor histidine kinase [Demequina sp. SO4-18]|uniref:sensor histidine kinase n=1 Tax=Demequina sp. SO4-18 TaxID=3401026 RepID=UPI003B59740F
MSPTVPPRRALSPVFAGLRWGQHVLFLALVGVVMVRAAVISSHDVDVIITLSLVLAATYAGGISAARTRRFDDHSAHRVAARVWLAALTVQWAVLLWLLPDAAYVAFPLFFVQLQVLGGWWGPSAVTVTTAIAIGGLGSHGGWTVGGIVGPLVGAGVAVVIGLGYRALARESQQREALVKELIETQSQLAAREHEAGVLAERSRLAREIHDTVGQGLSSIQMLLHAAERLDGGRPGLEHIALARDTAAANLAETRRFIRELTPPDLDHQGLGGALRRLARTRWSAHGLDVSVEVSDALVLPMHVQTALLRIAQGAMANVAQHAHAQHAVISLVADRGSVRFSVADDGVGFDPSVGARVAMEPSALLRGARAADSFGLHATRERVEQLGGVLSVESAPGRGSTLVVELAWEAE